MLNIDFNTAKALSVLNKILEHANKNTDVTKHFIYWENIKELGNILGINFEICDDIDENIKQIIKERELARKNKDWTKSDKLRNELHNMNISLEDTPNGTIWKKIN